MFRGRSFPQLQSPLCRSRASSLVICARHSPREMYSQKLWRMEYTSGTACRSLPRTLRLEWRTPTHPTARIAAAGCCRARVLVIAKAQWHGSPHSGTLLPSRESFN